MVFDTSREGRAIEGFLGTIIGEVARYGYLAIIAGMLVENAGLPIPSEPMLLFVGYLVHIDVLNFYGAVGAAVGGSVAGALLMYWLGAAGGRTFLLKYGRYIHLTPEALDRSEAWFARFGRGAVSGARIVPIIRTWVSLPAGIARMPLPQFVGFTTLGVLPWCIALVSAGIGLGAGWQTFELRLWSWDVLFVVLPALAVVGLVTWLWLRARRLSRAKVTQQGQQ